MYRPSVTHFKWGGICLRVGLHRTLIDATSTFQFINAWAKIACGILISNPSFVDPKLVVNVGISTSPKFHQYDTIIHEQLPYSKILKKKKIQLNPKPIFSPFLIAQINKLKEKSKKDHEPTIKITKFEIQAAHIWRRMCKTHGLSNDQASKLYMAINRRSRFNPPLPTGYSCLIGWYPIRTIVFYNRKNS